MDSMLVLTKVTKVSSMKFYTGKEDCDWLKATALRHIFVPKDFKSFLLYGNEDCPNSVELYADADPTCYDKPVEVIVFQK